MTETITVPSHWDIEYQHPAGEVGSRFLSELRDNETVLGKTCPDCGRTLAPPRAFCDQCFTETEEWVEIGPAGEIRAATIIAEDLGSGPEAPYVLAYVELDDADTALVNVVEGLDLSDLDEARKEIEVGAPVEVRWKPEDEREARITDFYYELV